MTLSNKRNLVERKREYKSNLIINNNKKETNSKKLKKIIKKRKINLMNLVFHHKNQVH